MFDTLLQVLDPAHPGLSAADARRVRLVAIAVVFVLAQIAIVFLGVTGVNAINVLRAYSAGEAQWSKAQKAAVIDLFRYAASRDPADYAAYEKEMRVQAGDQAARLTLQSAKPDTGVAQRGFLAGRNDPADVGALVWGFRLFRHWDAFATAIGDWERADREAAQLRVLAGDLHRAVESGASPQEVKARLARIATLDNSATRAATAFTDNVGRAARTARRLVLFLFGALSTLVAVVGGAIAWRIAHTGAKAEARAEESEARVRDFAEIASDWFCELDADFRITFMSDSFPRATETAEPDVVGGSWSALGRKFGYRALTENHLDVVAANRPFRDHRFEQTMPDGRICYWSVSGKPMFDQHGSFCGYRMTGTDITRTIRAQDALIRAKDEAVRANKAKSAFLANMSHELRTPLNAILGFSEIIETEVLGPVGEVRYRDYARDIHGSGEHLLAIINDILELSRIEAGHIDLHEERADIPAIIASAMTLCRARAEQAGVDIHVDVQPDLPPVLSDPLRIKQILINLISNGVKFTPRGGHVDVIARVNVSGSMSITVRDTGIGMAPDDVVEALRPFGQVENSLTRKFEGTGLGLPLAKSLIEHHGGTIAIQSNVGEGTRVVVTLPAWRVRARDTPAPLLRTAAGE